MPHQPDDLPEYRLDPPPHDDIVDCPYCRGEGCGFCHGQGGVPQSELDQIERDRAADAEIDRRL